MGFTFNAKSLEKFKGVHPDLVKVMTLAVAKSSLGLLVLEGMRTVERQRELFLHHATTTMHSRHLTGHAVDVAPLVGGKVRWDWPLYYQIAPVIKAAAKELNIPIEWGGDWRTFKDGPHWQLPFKDYPDGK